MVFDDVDKTTNTEGNDRCSASLSLGCGLPKGLLPGRYQHHVSSGVSQAKGDVIAQRSQPVDRKSKLRGINGLTRTKDDQFKVLQVGSSDLMAKDLQSVKEKISAFAHISGATKCTK